MSYCSARDGIDCQLIWNRQETTFRCVVQIIPLYCATSADLTNFVALVQQVWHGKGPAEDYEMVNYWDTKFPMNLFGTKRDALNSRSALELEPVAEVAEEADSRLGQPQPLRLRRLLLA